MSIRMKYFKLSELNTTFECQQHQFVSIYGPLVGRATVLEKKNKRYKYGRLSLTPIISSSHFDTERLHW